MKFKTLALLLITLLFSISTFALTLRQAKKSGWLQEQPSGYLAAAHNAPDDAVALMKKINHHRYHEYKRIASKNAIGVDTVAKIVGEKMQHPHRKPSRRQD